MDLITEHGRLALRRSDLLRDRAYIDGQWIDGPQRLLVTNPATGGLLGTIPEMGAIEAAIAVGTI